MCHTLVAPYCAIPRDYLSDTPLLRATGFLVSQHGQLGAIPPPPLLSVSPLETTRSGGAIPPLKRGISAILARYPMKTRQIGAIPPSAILSRNCIARYGGVSRTGPLRCHRESEGRALALRAQKLNNFSPSLKFSISLQLGSPWQTKPKKGRFASLFSALINKRGFYPH